MARSRRSAAFRQHCSRVPRPSRNEPIRSRRKKPPITTQQQMMLWPDPLLLVGRASIKPGQRSRFATSAASSLLSIIHQQLKIHRANLLLNRNVVFTVQEETNVTSTMLVVAVRSRHRARSRNRPHERRKRQLSAVRSRASHYRKISTNRRRKSQFTGGDIANSMGLT
jgi:hypothetical protein